MALFQNPDDAQVFFGMILFVLTMLAPLVPAVLAFRLLPDTRVAASGPLSRLGAKSSGAFAAYLVLLLVASAMQRQVQESISTMGSASWLIEGKVVVKSADGRIVEDESAYSGLQITMDPRQYGTGGRSFWVRIPEMGKRMPTVSLSVPTIGQQTIDLEQLAKDRSRRRIVLRDPVVIQQVRSDSPYDPTVAPPLVVRSAPSY